MHESSFPMPDADEILLGTEFSGIIIFLKNGKEVERFHKTHSDSINIPLRVK